MRCPKCGAIVPDGTPKCPHCHADFGHTQRIPVTDAQWCPHCGALVEKDMELCPKCGMPLPKALRQSAAPNPIRPQRNLRLPEIEEELYGTKRGKVTVLGTDGASGEKNVSAQENPDSYVSETSAKATSEFDGAHKLDPDSTAVVTLNERQPAPRFESAIPSEPSRNGDSERAEGMPGLRVVVFTAILALIVVGGSVLFITHPWDPSGNEEKTTQGTDLSKQGFPGVVEKLKGQDNSDTSAPSTDSDPSFDAMEADYKKLSELEERLNSNEATFDTVAISASKEDRQKAADDAQQTALEISNLIDDINNIDDAAGVYRTQLDNLAKLGNWLRNRSDALEKGWSLSLAAEDPKSAKDRILEPVDGMRDGSGKSEYQQLFEKNYDSWKPTKKQ